MKFYYLFLICCVFSLSDSENYPCSPLLVIDITNATKMENGTLTMDNITYTKNDYYQENGTTWGCICNLKKCFRKCCYDNQIWSNVNRSCTDNYEKYKFSSSIKFYNEFEENPDVTLNDFHVLYDQKCPIGYDYVPMEDEFSNMYLQEEGFLLYSDKKQYTDIRVQDTFCVDIDENETLYFRWCEEITQESPLLFINSISLLISIPFLFITFLVFLILPERTLHRCALMGYALSLLSGHICQLNINLPEGALEPVPCKIFAHLVMYFYLVSFCWLNVMSLDMWLTFRNTRGYVNKNTLERKKIIIFGSYACGLPALYVAIIALIDAHSDPDNPYIPNVGYERCFLADEFPTLYYFYLPIAVLISVNIILFVLTAIKIFVIKKETRVLKRTDSKVHTSDVKPKFNLYLKLMFAMGVNWTLELISFIITWQFKESCPEEVFYVTDVMNALYGIFIFFIFVFNKKVFFTLKKRFFILTGLDRGSSKFTRSLRSDDTTVVTSEFQLVSFNKSKPEEVSLNNKI